MGGGPGEEDAASGEVAVIGATSLVGHYLMPRLAQGGYRGEVVSRREQAMGLPPGFIWRRIDLSRDEGWRPAAGAVVVSLAPLWLIAERIGLFAGVRQLVALGSTSVVGKAASRDRAEQTVVARLRDAEPKVASGCDALGVPWTVLRPTMIYDGRRDKNLGAIVRFVRRFGFFPVAAPGRGLRQPIHADDVAAAIVAALGNGRVARCAFDLPGGETLSYREMVRRVFVATGRPVRIVPVPTRVLALSIHMLRPFLGAAYSAEAAVRMNSDLAYDGAPAWQALGMTPRGFALAADPNCGGTHEQSC